MSTSHKTQPRDKFGRFATTKLPRDEHGRFVKVRSYHLQPRDEHGRFIAPHWQKQSRDRNGRFL